MHSLHNHHKKARTKLTNKNQYHITKIINIIQWNINGFFKKQEELKLIIQNHDPRIICLQEMNFKDNFTAHLNNYVSFSKNRRTPDRTSGGVTIYIKSNIPIK